MSDLLGRRLGSDPCGVSVLMELLERSGGMTNRRHTERAGDFNVRTAYEYSMARRKEAWACAALSAAGAHPRALPQSHRATAHPHQVASLLILPLSVKGPRNSRSIFH